MRGGADEGCCREGHATDAAAATAADALAAVCSSSQIQLLRQRSSA